MNLFDHWLLVLSKLYQNHIIILAIILNRPKEKDLVAIHHEKKWFRGQYLNSTGININVLCIDSGVTITCSRNGKKYRIRYKYSSFFLSIDIRRLPDM